MKKLLVFCMLFIFTACCYAGGPNYKLMGQVTWGNNTVTQWRVTFPDNTWNVDLTVHNTNTGTVTTWMQYSGTPAGYVGADTYSNGLASTFNQAVGSQALAVQDPSYADWTYNTVSTDGYASPSWDTAMDRYCGGETSGNCTTCKLQDYGL